MEVGAQLNIRVKLTTTFHQVLIGKLGVPNNTLGMENPQDLPYLSLALHISFNTWALNLNLKNPNSK
jgi:hypothetical protein